MQNLVCFIRSLGTPLLSATILLASFTIAHAQFLEGETSDKGPKLDSAAKQKIKIGLTVKASGGRCKGIVGTVPVPTEWPEQTVQIVEEDIAGASRNISYRSLGNGGAKQMVVTIPQLSSGEEAHAYITFEVTRHALAPPEDTSIYQECPKNKLPRELLQYLGNSPYIESNHPKIIKLAREVTEGKSGWEKVEALYDATREKVEYKNGPLKGALKALMDGTGDCEELTSLFVALCRASGIPARCVWVPEHCYPEFYLVDGEGKGYWFPCQAAGAREFGGIIEHRPILQKGDNFRDPDRPAERLRYVNEHLKGAAVKGGGRPKVEFTRELVQ